MTLNIKQMLKCIKKITMPIHMLSNDDDDDVGDNDD